MENETKYAFEEAIKYLSIFIGIDLNDGKQRALLFRAIDYAELSNYTPTPTSTEQWGYNEIFTTKAMCYFKRKMLPVTDRDKITEIFNYEFNTIAQLKRKVLYHPKP